MMATRIDTLEPIPIPERPPEEHLSPRDWARKNLFGSRLDTVLTIVFGLVVAWLVYRLGKFVFVDARWEIIERNITNLMVSRFPRDELWRVWGALLVLGPSLGFGAGTAAAARRREVEEGRAVAIHERYSALRRAGPILLLVAVLLWFAQSFQATLLTVAVGALGVGGYFLGRRLALEGRKAALIVLAGIVLAFAIVMAFGGVGWETGAGSCSRSSWPSGASCSPSRSASSSRSDAARACPPSAWSASPTSSFSAAFRSSQSSSWARS